ITDLYSSVGILSSENFNFGALMLSSIVHVDWSHLLSNVFMLLMLGVWVEQKMGTTSTLGLFIAGSLLGLTMQVLTRPLTPVLGASAGINAIMGAFFVFFYKADFRFIFTTLFHFQKISLPVYWSFPVLFFAGDILG